MHNEEHLLKVSKIGENVDRIERRMDRIERKLDELIARVACRPNPPWSISKITPPFQELDALSFSLRSSTYHRLIDLLG